MRPIRRPDSREESVAENKGLNQGPAHVRKRGNRARQVVIIASHLGRWRQLTFQCLWLAQWFPIDEMQERWHQDLASK
jgi:hypothetical protein